MGLTPRERFVRRVQRCVHSRDCTRCCWPWVGATDAYGYGRTRWCVFGEVEYFAHRVAYALSNGRVAGDWHVCHHCDNPPCCNPSHLWLGTHLDNIRDRDTTGRGKRGMSLATSTLSQAQRRAMLRHWRAGTSQRRIAALIGVSQPYVSMVLRAMTAPHQKTVRRVTHA